MNQCKTCGGYINPYDKRSKRNRRTVFCSSECYNKNKNRNKTAEEVRYSRISGNWEKYFSRLITKNKTKHKERFKLTLEDLLYLYKNQDGKCALTGRTLTCRLIKGVLSPENASLDRIVAGGPYSLDNVHLTCKDVNGFRLDTPLKNFIHICTLVAKHSKETS